MQNERYRLFDLMMEGVQIIGSDLKYLYMNEAALRHSKYSLDELIGHTMAEKYPGIEQTEVYAQIQRCLSQGSSHKMMNEFKFPDGSTGYFEIRIQPVPEGTLILSIDVTEQKLAEKALQESEERYRMIFDGIEEGFVVHEIIRDEADDIIDLRFMEVNPAAEKIFGKSYSELKGRKRSELMGSLDSETLDIVKRAVTLHESIKIQRYIPSLEKWFEILVYSPGPDRIANLNLDITDRKLAEERLRKMNLELEDRIKERTQELIHSLERERDLNDMKSNLVSMASHEFRTPLSTLLTSVSLFEKYLQNGDEEKCIKHISRAKHSIETLTNILNDFLSLEKLEKGKVEVVQEFFSLQVFVQEIIEDLQGICKQGQRIQCHLHGNSNVLLDKKILHNILLNLLSNAIKYSERDVELKIESGMDEVKITITDHGIGIPDQELGKIFSMFFRANNAGKIQGTGLGLNIVKRYVDLMDGNIAFESKLNVGTSFRVVLPQNGQYEKKPSRANLYSSDI